VASVKGGQKFPIFGGLKSSQYPSGAKAPHITKIAYWEMIGY
jgi:hypothetical protein